MIKHIGTHNNRKIVVLYRTVPDEDHMCLVVYNDSIPSAWQNTIKTVLESPVGQNAAELADVLHRNLLPEGGNVLTALHKGGVIKKIQTSQVIMTPTTTSSVRLDELNKILAEMEQGEDAVRRMAEIDAQSGVKDHQKLNEMNTRSGDVNGTSEPIPYTPPADGVLQDSDLAQMNLNQANDMTRQAENMIVEAKRLQEEAYALDPTTKPVVAKPTAKKRVAKKKVAKKKVAKKAVAK